MTEPARALSLTQPWASLVIGGAKRIETRSWSTPYRGRLWIHASKGFPWYAQETCFDEPFRTVLRELGFVKQRDLPRGALLGTVELLDCIPTDDAGGLVQTLGAAPIELNDQERAFGEYGPGRFGWLLNLVQVLDEPIPARGALGLWNVPPDVLSGGAAA